MRYAVMKLAIARVNFACKVLRNILLAIRTVGVPAAGC
jgi:hypothetical protein